MLKSLKTAFLCVFILLATLVPTKLGNRSEWVPDAKERQCLVQALWHEARGEDELGIRAVATVILNRSEKALDKSTKAARICSVVSAPWQFSYWWQVKVHTPKVKPQEVQKLVLMHKIADEVQRRTFVPVLDKDVLFYHTTKVNPIWNRKMQTVAVIGKHKFLKQKDQRS